MKQIFDFVKNNILNGMPTGCLVTRHPIGFDVGGWEHKTYENNDDIKNTLKKKWCSSTINLLILDDRMNENQIFKFIHDNDFSIYGRSIFLTYCLAIPKSIITDNIRNKLKSSIFLMNNFNIEIFQENYVVLVCDFVKNILKL